MTAPEPSPAELADRCSAAWQARDGQALAKVLADDVTFRSPLGIASGRQERVAGLLGSVTGMQVHARVANATGVITRFDSRTSVAEPAATANWSHVEDAKITRTRVSFDPRGILAAGS